MHIQASIHCLRLVFVFTVLLISANVFASFEVRIGYGLVTSKQSITDLCSGCSSPAGAPDMPSNYGLGIDAIFRPAFLPPGLGLGLRYENLGFSASANNIEAKTANNRASALLSYRLIDSIIFMGPIGTMGFSHSGSFEISESGNKVASYGAGNVTSYSGGFELGVKLIAFSIAAELGYLDEKWKDANSAIGSGSTKDISFSGNYAKIHLGFGF